LLEVFRGDDPEDPSSLRKQGTSFAAVSPSPKLGPSFRWGDGGVIENYFLKVIVMQMKLESSKDTGQIPFEVAELELVSSRTVKIQSRHWDELTAWLSRPAVQNTKLRKLAALKPNWTIPVL
jgi:hypothetical protein